MRLYIFAAMSAKNKTKPFEGTIHVSWQVQNTVDFLGGDDRSFNVFNGMSSLAGMHDMSHAIGQEDLVSCSSDYSTRWLAIK
jgi:hypothetical protein